MILAVTDDARGTGPRLPRCTDEGTVTMGFLDKLKGAVNAVTGNASKVTIESSPSVVARGARK